MRRVVGSLVVLLILGGLFVRFRKGWSLTDRPGMQESATAGEGLSDPPTWKVEPAGSLRAGRAQTGVSSTSNSRLAVANSGTTSGSAPAPVYWSRRPGKFPPIGSAYLPRNSSIVPPHATILPRAAQEPALPPEPKPANDQSIVAAPQPNTVSAYARRTRGPDALAQEEYRVLLNHAKFLIKAGLGPMAKEPLQQILRGAPGTPIALEARVALDSIRN
jgi:hypothetical protein